jgi:hypothetical protein
MANALNRELKIGDKLVMNGAWIVEVDALTFGCHTVTSGRKIAVREVATRIPHMVDGYDIDVEATLAQFTADNGWRDPIDAAEAEAASL